MPILYIIAGPNGAGKTTTAQKILPDNLKVVEFVNADNIAKGLSPFNPEGVAFEAGRIMLTRIKELAEQKIDFALETTLSTLSYVKFVKDCKSNGYEVVLIYVWLNSPQLAVDRVAERVSKGGHNIPEDIIFRRYSRGIQNFRKYFVSLIDDWMIIDNSGEKANFIAESKKSEITVLDKLIFNQILGK